MPIKYMKLPNLLPPQSEEKYPSGTGGYFKNTKSILTLALGQRNREVLICIDACSHTYIGWGKDR